MQQPLPLGRIAGLQLSAAPSALAGSFVLWLVFTILTMIVRGGSILESVLLGFVGMLLYWLGEILHQLSHAFAAQQTGYPMSGVRLWGVLGTSLYPDEPSLPARSHLRRAFGGPIGSIAIGVIVLVVFLLLRLPITSSLGWLLALFAAINILFYGIGSFIPLGFTDGSTILEWWGKQ